MKKLLVTYQWSDGDHNTVVADSTAEASAKVRTFYPGRTQEKPLRIYVRQSEVTVHKIVGGAQ